MMEKKNNGKTKNVVFTILAFIIMAGVAVGYYFYWENNNYFATDNAKVAAKLYPVTAQGSGKLQRLSVSEGSFVEQNEIIAKAENGPYVRSPINGLVVKSDVVRNQIVAPTTVVAVVADSYNAYINANIEETDIAKIKEGQPVTVTLDAYPGKTFRAHVGRVEGVTQSALTGQSTSFSTSGTYTKVTQVIPVKINMDDNVSLENLIGTNATIKIKIR
jgi:multidrug resistance efflux pump